MEINFGTKHKLNVPDGALELIPEKYRNIYPNYQPIAEILQNECYYGCEETKPLPTVRFKLGGGHEPAHSGLAEYSHNKMLLICIPEPRSEWIAVHEYVQGATDYQTKEQDHSFTRDYSHQSGSDDRSYCKSKFNGPYTLDTYCKEALANTLKVELKSLDRDITKISFSELEKIAKKS